jgi:hypothetical protein
MRVSFVSVVGVALFSAVTAAAALNPAFIRGSAVLKVGGTSRLYLYVESDDAVRTALRQAIREESGGVIGAPSVQPRGVDHAFVLACDEPIGGPAVVDLSDAVISVSPGRVVATSASDRTVVVLALSDSPDPANEHFPAGYNVLRFHGFGLTHKVGALGTPLQKARKFVARDLCDGVIDPYCVENLDPGGGGGSGSSCGSGGSGASQCGCSAGGDSCSVSCVSGYYACCNCGLFGSTCTCVRQ